jgi:purine-nucleoside phosphorylase
MTEKQDDGRRKFLQIAALGGTGMLLSKCSGKFEKKLLEEYYKYNDGKRLIDPKEYISYLKSHFFIDGELDNLPDRAIILHDALAENRLAAFGYDYSTIQTGVSDPNVMYIAKKNNGCDFILNKGLPGAGGIATQAAELYALGVKYIVHIGSCGLLGRNVSPDQLFLSEGSYKDGAAAMLSVPEKGEISILAKPSETLTKKLEASLSQSMVQYTKCCGFTTPIFYFQPAGMIKALIEGDICFSKGNPRPVYIEMENASLFQTAEMCKGHAASIVYGVDRYFIKEWNAEHEFLDVNSLDQEMKAMEIAMHSFGRLT